MTRKLHVEVGGLCMLVQRTNAAETGLFVLMPEMNMVGHAHCQYMITGVKDDARKRKPGVKRIGGKVIDLRHIADNTKISALRTEDYAQMSVYAGGTRVNPEVFDVKKTRGRLAASVILPLSMTEEDGGFDKAEMIVPSANGGEERAFLVGRVLFTVDVADEVAADLMTNGILGRPLEEDDNGDLKVWFVNVRPKDLGLQKYKHTEGEPSPHVHAYYDLLEHPPKKPEIKIGKGQEGSEDHVSLLICAAGEQQIKSWPPPILRGNRELFFIDPFNCTIGTGCEEPC